MLRVRWSSALAESQREGRWKGWRAVEAQHVVSTLRLTGSDPERQELLERILEESKPAVPEAAQGLHYLLMTPFRYPPSRHGSRFRAWPDAGVLYAAAERRTACAEMGYWRWRFAQESVGMDEIPAAAQTVFRLGVAGQGIDLETEPWTEWEADWTDRERYGETQALAREARGAGVQWIGYRSVRDPLAGKCYAVLDAGAIRPKTPLERETWYLTVRSSGAIWQRERERFVFRYD
jgi:hypothetical protein